MANNVAKVAADGDRYATLLAVRDRVAQELDDATYGRDVAVLAQRLTAVLAEIDDLPQSRPTAAADVIAARRAARRAQGSA